MEDHVLISGSGNTFTVSDNRDGHIRDIVACAKELCGHGKTDGSLFIEPSSKADFRMRIINADGSEAEMCGNGSRCAALYAFDNHIVPAMSMKFETIAGIITGEVKEDGRVKVGLTAPSGFNEKIAVTTPHYKGNVAFINTGVPHAIVLTDEIDTIDVFTIGSEIRNSVPFQPSGTNVNFVKVIDEHHIAVRTYERGVENETLACGTGSTASSLVTCALGKTSSPVRVLTHGGEELVISFEKTGNTFRNVSLEGIVRYMKKGGS